MIQFGEDRQEKDGRKINRALEMCGTISNNLTFQELKFPRRRP